MVLNFTPPHGVAIGEETYPGETIVQQAVEVALEDEGIDKTKPGYHAAVFAATHAARTVQQYYENEVIPAMINTDKRAEGDA